MNEEPLDLEAKYNQSHLYMLAGYLSSRIPELEKVPVPLLLDAVDKFIETVSVE